MQSQALLRSAKGESSSAELRAVLAMRRQLLDDTNPAVVETLINLGVQLMAEHDLKEADQILGEGLSLSRPARDVLLSPPRRRREMSIWKRRKQAPSAADAVRVRSMGIWEVKTAPRSPWQSPYVERLIGRGGPGDKTDGGDEGSLSEALLRKHGFA